MAFNYPQDFDIEWGIDATDWAQAVTNGMLQMAGGNFPLTAQVNFGGNFGITTLDVVSHTINPASVGFIRLAKTDAMEWRNNANTANLALTIDGSDMLTFNGSVLGLTNLTNNHIYVGNSSNLPIDVAMSGDATIIASGALTIANGAINNAKVASGAAIAVNKLAAQTINRAIISDSSGFITVSPTTATEIGYVSGVTSSIQAQINSVSTGTIPSGAMLDFAGVAAPSGWLLCDGSSYTAASQPTLFSAIGYTWGGSGANFNVPNMTRRVGMGSGGTGTGTIGNAVGNIGGEEAHTLTQAELSVGLGTVAINDPSHQHSRNKASGSNINVDNTGSTRVDVYGSPTATDGNSLTSSNTTGITATITNSSGGNAHNNVQPSAIVLKIIKT